MATKIVRMYFSTFVDVEMESENFSSDKEIKEYVRLNASDYIEQQQVMDNLALEPTDIDVYNEEDM